VIRLYGSPITRAQRVMWMLEELGLAYEQIGSGIPTQVGGGKLVPREEIEKLNPSGKVPVLVDGDLALTESYAINLYLATRYESELTPRTPQEWGRAYQWTAWLSTEVEAAASLAIALRRGGDYDKLPEALRAHDAFGRYGVAMHLRTLERGLDPGPWLLGDRFTVADLNIQSLLVLARLADIDFGGVPGVSKWLDEGLARPAARRSWGIVLDDARALGFVGDLTVDAPAR